MFNSPSNEGEFMADKQLQALANELAKNLKTPEDLSQFDRLLKKIKVEAALNAELTHHLGHEKNQPKSGTNSWICPYISRHLLSLNPLLACCRRYSRGER